MAGMPRPQAARRSASTGLSNAELAATFREIGDLLNLLDEVPYKAVAYRRVADAIERYPADLAPLSRLLFSDHLLSFEALSILLLAALVGAFALARREGSP